MDFSDFENRLNNIESFLAQKEKSDNEKLNFIIDSLTNIKNDINYLKTTLHELSNYVNEDITDQLDTIKNRVW